MDVQWLSWSNGCHKAMDVTKQWMSQSNVCHKAMDVTKQWMSQGNGCHRAMDVTKQWMSQRFGGKSRTKASFSQDKTCLGRCVGKLVRRTCETVSVVLGSCSHRPRSGTDSSGVIFLAWTFKNLKDVSHESVVFTSSNFRFWGKSRTKTWFSHRPPANFDVGSAPQWN